MRQRCEKVLRLSSSVCCPVNVCDWSVAMEVEGALLDTV